MAQKSEHIILSKDANWWQRTFIELAKTKRTSFVVDKNNKDVIYQLCLFFAKDKRFNGSLQKGIYIAGPVGTGKTFILKTFVDIIAALYNTEDTARREEFRQHHPSINFGEFSPISRIVNDFVTGGTESIKKVISTRTIRCFDDLGAEAPESQHMGNKLSVMGWIIGARYDLEGPFNNFLMTGNLGKSQIEAVYGQRIKSRLVEMCNWIELLGEDRRK